MRIYLAFNEANIYMKKERNFNEFAVEDIFIE